MKKLFYAMMLLVICSANGIYAQGLTYTPFLERPLLCQTFSPHIRSHNINGRNLQLGNQKQQWNVLKTA